MSASEREATGEVTDGLIVRGRPPFAMTPTSLLRNPSISSHAVRLWSVLASYTYGDQATERPSRSQLAADVGWKSTRSVDTYLSELEVAGYLTIQRRWRPDGGKARNLYILEWEPQDRSVIGRSVDPGPVDNSVFPAQTHAQNSAHGGTDPGPGIVDNSVSAAQTHAQDPAHGVDGSGTHAQDSAHTHAQDPAHLGKETTTKKKPPPTAPVPGVGGPGGPPATPTGNLPADGPDPATDALLRTLRCTLPDRLRCQLTGSALRARAVALAQTGWTDRALAAAVTTRRWDGAGPGAVMVWLGDLASAAPAQTVTEQEDSKSRLRRLRADRAAAIAAAAPPDSPSRRRALDISALLAKNRPAD